MSYTTGILIFENVEELDFVGPWEVFTMARSERGSGGVVTISERGGPVACSKGLKVIATSLDGKVVEAMRHTRYSHVLGIQFHPEYSFVWKPSIVARLHRSHPDKNYFTAALAKAPASREFHRQIWRKMSRWVAAQKTAASAATARR